ncbi:MULTISPECIES: LysR substrate-binding domain-containing protein [unclassified Halomonas]|uniref:LysR substrate-binding domain-containing protein n=1 Tax=unclassified Halomonas TaxID=2609666 RepID=UPI000C8E472A|nr:MULTISPECIES: LysR substrate-binding domain-containing protein [unclassified Halomonas]MAR71171.1 LysR family transcriptional regulator [Halomonas sp.]MBR9878219.1 LysR family transcriptional regulator [Gammaproteobacteria bacterium]
MSDVPRHQTSTAPLPLDRLPPLSALKGFEAAARLSSLRAAAEELHLSHPAIANQIQRLEQSLGTKLFARRGRHIELTASGRRFYPVVRDALEALILGAETLRRQSCLEPLRVQVYVTTSIRWLAPRLAQFHQRYPETELRIKTYSLDWTFDSAHADIAILFRDGPLPSRLDWTPLFPSTLTPVCSPSLVMGHSLPLSPEALQAFPLISVYTESWSWQGWFDTQSPSATRPAPPRALQVDTLAAALEMAARGEGVALVNGPFAEDDLATGRLINPAGKVQPASGEWGIAYPSHLADDPRVEAFSTWLLSQRG